MADNIPPSTPPTASPAAPQSPVQSPFPAKAGDIPASVTPPPGGTPAVPQSPPMHPHGVTKQSTQPTDSGTSEMTAQENSGADPNPIQATNPPQPTDPLPDDLAAQWRRTKCTNCGFVHEGTSVMEKCPRCGNTDKDKFEEVD